jgi:GDP-4-dehydro-6-deoxy-D-mannose reductase
LRSTVTLITGAEGFVGSWLVRHLQDLHWRIVGTCKPGCAIPAQLADSGQVEWIEVDLRDRAAVHALLRDAKPTYIVHLAGIALPREAAANPIESLRVNYGVTDALLEAMAIHTPAARLIHVGTGEAYGPRPEGTPPLCEEEPLRPPTLYSATKTAAEVRSLEAVQRDDLDVIAVRPLNHSGPGRPQHYAESAFARQIVRIERGDQEPVLQVGNLDDVRDFSDVRDVVRAYVLLLRQGQRGQVYNVCSGRAWKIRAVLDHLISCSNITPEIQVDPALYRHGNPDQRVLVGNPGRLSALGWTPRYRFEETLDDLLEDWRSRA